jgi:NADH-quinone oxidoreductase subunit E
MAWTVEDRRMAAVEDEAGPRLTEELKKHIAETYFPRYPTKRAVTLPALHAIQHEFGWISMRAMEELAEFLELAPAEVLDTATFYEEYWLKPKGKYLIQVCRSLACEICGSKQLTERVKQKLGIEVGQTTADGNYTLVELECLGSCGTAPCALVNEVLHETISPDQLEKAIDALPGDPHAYHDPTVNWKE